MTTQTIYICKFFEPTLSTTFSTIFFDQTDALNYQSVHGGEIYTMKILVELGQI